MDAKTAAFLDELEKLGYSDAARTFGTSAAISGLFSLLQGDVSPGAVKGAIGFGAGDLAGKAVAQTLGLKGWGEFLTRATGAIVGSRKARELGQGSAAPQPQVHYYMPRQQEYGPDPYEQQYPKFAAIAPSSTLTPQSSNVAGWRYDAKTKQLFVTFKNGGSYRYDDVPPTVPRALKRNKSVGKTLNKQVKKPGYSYEKLGAYTCKFCKEPATKGVLWAEGRAIVPCCDKHLEKAKSSTDGEVDGIRDLTKKATGDLVKSPENKASFLRERLREGGAPTWGKALSAKERFVLSRTKTAASIMDQMRQKRRYIAKLAGEAKKTLTWGGLTMKFEYLTGDTRSGVNGATGKEWSRKMRDNYGYVPGTYGKGKDGDAIDVYFSDTPVDGPVFKVRQKKRTGEYDEDKYMVGYGTAHEAKKAFLRNMPEWAFGSMMGMSMNGFRKLVGQSQRQVRPPKDDAAEHARVLKILKGRAA
jgi:hypothetical protein